MVSAGYPTGEGLIGLKRRLVRGCRLRASSTDAATNAESLDPTCCTDDQGPGRKGGSKNESGVETWALCFFDWRTRTRTGLHESPRITVVNYAVVVYSNVNILPKG